MIANGFVVAKTRHQKHGKIAGSDFYDLHRFLYQGLQINRSVIEERGGKPFSDYVSELHDFVQQYLTDAILLQDLNPLLPPPELRRRIKHLKEGLLMYLKTL